MSKPLLNTGAGISVVAILALCASVAIAVNLLDIRIALFGVIASLILFTLTNILNRLDEIVFYLQKK
jgi:hypothetical protein